MSLHRQNAISRLSIDQHFLWLGLTLVGLSLTIFLFGLVGHPLVLIVPVAVLVFLHAVGPSNIRVPLKPLPLYLLFSTVFYIHRDLFGWGPASSTQYDEQVPVVVQLAKDMIWVVFLVLISLHFRSKWTVISEHIKRNFAFFAVIFAYAGWLLFNGSLRTGALSLTQITLIYLRNPTEYLPILFLMPWFIRSPKDLTTLGKTIFTLDVIVIGFLGYQMATGSQVGMDWGGMYRRLGSVFGSPNDMGVFCAWNLTGLIALWGTVRLSLTGRLILLLGLSWGLVMSVSVSALICAIVGITIVFALGQFRHSVVAIMLLSIAVGLGIYSFRNSSIVEYAAVRFIDPITKGSLDDSQLQHLSELTFIESEIGLWTPSEFVFGSNNMRRVVAYNPDNRAAVENYYFSLLLRSGAPATLLFLTIICLTLRRAFRLRRIDPPLGTAGIATIASGAAAFTFIPYPDVFPTNLFFWVMAGLVWVLPLTTTNGNRSNEQSSFVTMR